MRRQACDLAALRRARQRLRYQLQAQVGADGRACRCSARASTSMPRSSTTRRAAPLAAASTLDKALREQLKTGADKDAAAAVGKLVAERALAAGRQGGRVRPRRLSVSWPGQGAGRCRPRRRAVVLRDRRIWHVNREKAAAGAIAIAAATATRDDGIDRQAGHHQPRRQGGEGRPALRLRRPGRGRRPEGPRRLWRRQGARGAGGDPQGDRTRQARHDPRADEGRPHPAPRRRGPLSAPAT